jgi:hypothetical protein
MTIVITTFSKDGYELYGHRMIDSWIKFWPEGYQLIVYTEGYDIVEKDPRITCIDINEACPDLDSFKKRSHELSDRYKKSTIDKTIKWCHKVYAVGHALNTEHDYLIFLDGDTYTKKSINRTFPAQLVGDNLFAVHFERLKHGLHFETGLIVFNLRHPDIEWLKNILTTAYDSLEIYSMPKTWDGYWFAHLYTKYQLPVADLSRQGSGVFGHPLVKPYLQHDVGTKKYRVAGYDKFTGRKHN